MKQLGLGVSKVDWTTTIDFVVEFSVMGSRMRQGMTKDVIGDVLTHFDWLRTQTLTPNPKPQTLNHKP